MIVGLGCSGLIKFWALMMFGPCGVTCEGAGAGWVTPLSKWNPQPDWQAGRPGPSNLSSQPAMRQQGYIQETSHQF